MHKPKNVLITGSTGDFGKAFSKRFASIGCHIILHGRNIEKLNDLKKELESEYKSKVDTLCFDMKNQDAVQLTLSSKAALLQNVDLLINNAGCALGQSAADEIDLQDWLDMIDINNRSLSIISHCLAKIMVKNKKGHIINIGSIAGTYPYPGGSVYCASKAFVKQLSLALRADLYAKNIRITNIEPGMVHTQFSNIRFKGDTEKADKVYANTQPLTADDIAESVFWAATLPSHVNINTMEIMPTRQAPGPLNVDRDQTA